MACKLEVCRVFRTGRRQFRRLPVQVMTRSLFRSDGVLSKKQLLFEAPALRHADAADEAWLEMSLLG